LTFTSSGNQSTYTLTASSSIDVESLFIGGTTTVGGAVTVANGIVDIESNSNVAFLAGSSLTVQGTGTEIVVQGNLTLDAGTTLLAPAATLDLVSGSYTGPVDFGTMIVSGSVTLTGTDSGAGSVGTLEFEGGTLNLATNLTAGTLSMTPLSDLTGSGVLTVTGGATVQAGLFTGPGTTIFQGALTIEAQGTFNNAFGLGIDNGRVVELEGTTTWEGGLISLNAQRGATAGTLINEAGAEFDVTFDGGTIGTAVINSGSSANTGIAGALFNNEGLFRKKSGNGTTTVATAFTNEGTIEADEGTLDFTGSFTNTGSEVFGPTGSVIT
jgi:hypothetical protein